MPLDSPATTTTPSAAAAAAAAAAASIAGPLQSQALLAPALLTSRSIENNSAARSLEQDSDSSDSYDSFTGTRSFDIAATDSGNSVYQPSNTALSFNRHEKGSKSILKLKRQTEKTWDGPQLNTVITTTLQSKTKRTNL